MSRPTLMVTPYPPYRDGIAAYAVQEVRAMRREGRPVEVLSPLPSAAHHHLALGGVRGMAALVKRARRYDSIIIQFSPEMIFGACRTPAQRVAVWGLLLALSRETRLEIRLHEIEYGPLANNPAERAVARRALSAADRLTVHTAREVDELVERIGLRADAVTVVDHGSSFAAATSLDRAAAREELGLAADEHLFLCIGFLQEHKGFDIAVEAFDRADLSAVASLHVVGSVRVDNADLLAYAQRLAGLCRGVAGAELHERYVSDEEFDLWIVAADTIVLPYREIWSSGVMERAKLYGRSVVATDVGGMGDQAPEGTLFFTDRATLVKAMRERVAVEAAPSGPPSDGSDGSVGSDSDRATASGTVEAVDRGWDVDVDSPDPIGVEAQIRSRVRARQLSTAPGAVAVSRAAAVDPLLALGPLQRPHAVSARPGVTQVKRVMRRLLGWELDPIADRLDALQRASVEAVAALEARLSSPDAPGPSEAEVDGAGEREATPDG